MKNFLIFYINLLFIFTLVSCEKEEPVPSKSEILTAETWKMSKVIMDGKDVSNNPTNNPNSIMFVRLKFNSDGTYLETAGNGYTNPGVWEFTNNENSIVLDKGMSDEESLEIIELTDNFFRATGFSHAYDPPIPIDFEMVHVE